MADHQYCLNLHPIKGDCDITQFKNWTLVDSFSFAFTGSSGGKGKAKLTELSLVCPV